MKGWKHNSNMIPFDKNSLLLLLAFDFSFSKFNSIDLLYLVGISFFVSCIFLLKQYDKFERFSLYHEANNITIAVLSKKNILLSLKKHLFMPYNLFQLKLIGKITHQSPLYISKDKKTSYFNPFIPFMPQYWKQLHLIFQ